MANIRSSIRWSVGACVLAAGTLALPGHAAAACGDAPAPGVDWSNCSFGFADLADIDVSNSNLRGVDLSYAILFRANMASVDLRDAILRDAFLIGTNLSGANLTGADLSDADLVGANLDNAILVRTDLSRSDVDLSSLAGASFVGADLALADFSDVQGASAAVFGLPPRAVADAVVTWEDRAVRTSLLANDDPGDTNPYANARVRIIDRPLHGTLGADGATYVPNAGFSGTDEYTYRMVDRLTWPNLPAGAVSEFSSQVVTVTVEVKATVDVGAPYAGTSGVEGEIVRLYVALLRRVPDEGGFRFWVEQRRAGRPLAAIARSFQASSEFLDANAQLSNVEFVTLLYHNVLERQPDPGGLEFWVGQLDSGARTTDSVVLAFTESIEFKRQTNTA